MYKAYYGTHKRESTLTNIDVQNLRSRKPKHDLANHVGLPLVSADRLQELDLCGAEPNGYVSHQVVPPQLYLLVINGHEWWLNMVNSG